MPKFAYFYFMKPKPENVRAIAPAHADYWHNLKLPNYVGGPFEDRTGGLIIFSADDFVTADELVKNDPFQIEGLIQEGWMKIWLVEEV